MVEAKTRKALWDFVINELYTCSKLIIPRNEIKLLKNRALSKESIYQFLFVIDRYLSNKILPFKYNIYKSSKFNIDELDDVHKKSLECIEKLLRDGDISINSRSRNFVPKSYKHYLKDDIKEIVKDFSGSIWGIKHLHLNPKKHDDVLLFYLTSGDNFYFIKIGNHDDFFKKDALEIFVNEFPDVVEKTNITYLKDISHTECNYTPKEVEDLWKAGGNVSYSINGKYYVSLNPQTVSTYDSNLCDFTNAISIPLEKQLEAFLLELQQFEKIDAYEFITEEDSLKFGTFFIKERNSGYKKLIKIDYLRNLEYVRYFKSLNLER